MKVEIDIDNYLSEDEKRQIAQEAFASEIRKCVSGGRDGVFGDAETLRVIGNITHHSVRKIMEEYIPDFESQIRNQVKSIIDKKDLTYYIFQRADRWGAPETQSIKWIDDVVRESKDIILENAKSAIKEFAYKDEVREGILNYISEQQSTLYQLESVLCEQVYKESDNTN